MASRAATGRAVAIGVALVLALGAVFLLWRYASQADERAFEGAELVDVFVAAESIPQGLSAQSAVSQQLIDRAQIPRANVPPNPVANLQDIDGLAATAPVYEGQILVLANWGDPTLISNDLDIPPDRVAMSLEVDVPNGVSNHIVQGDRIGVIGHLEYEGASTRITDPDGEPIAEAESEGRFVVSQYVVGDVEVLSVGRRVVTTDEAGESSDAIQQTEQVLLTVAVTVEDSERLSFVATEGTMYFTLLPDDFVFPNTTPGATGDNVLPDNPLLDR